MAPNPSERTLKAFQQKQAEEFMCAWQLQPLSLLLRYSLLAHSFDTGAKSATRIELL